MAHSGDFEHSHAGYMRLPRAPVKAADGTAVLPSGPPGWYVRGVSSSCCWRNAPVQVLVRENNVDQALRALKKKMQREGVFREMKLRRSYEKPSERRARERAEAVRRYRKLLRKRMEREGY
jgi:small subunit ribosomal protein S21